VKQAMLAVLVTLGMAATASAQVGDVSGQWDLSLATPEGAHQAVLVLKKAGEALDGTITGAPGQFPIKGTQKGDTITVAFTIPRDDGPMLITLTGSQSGNSVEGTATFGPDGKGTWTGTRTAASPPAGAPDATGTWLMEVTTDNGSGTPTVVLKQDSDQLTGTYEGQLGQARVTGTAKGAAVTFGFDISVQDTALHVVYTGTLEGDIMSGTVVLGDFGGGTFKGTRKTKP
jgi:hypothetical protein